MREQVKCPCCNQPIESYPLDVLEGVVTPKMAEIIVFLRRKPGQYLSARSIADFIYRRDSDGGPDQAETSISNAITYNRRKLHAMGWDVRGRIGPGGGYSLISLTGAA